MVILIAVGIFIGQLAKGVARFVEQEIWQTHSIMCNADLAPGTARHQVIDEQDWLCPCQLPGSQKRVYFPNSMAGVGITIVGWNRENVIIAGVVRAVKIGIGKRPVLRMIRAALSGCDKYSEYIQISPIFPVRLLRKEII